MPKSKPRTLRSQQPKIELTIDLGQNIKLTVRHGTNKPIITDISRLIANFQDAVDEPQQSYSLADYCGENFFKHKTGISSRDLYSRTLEGNADGAEWFVEYGAHIGSLIANLETLFHPSHIKLSGPITTWFDAWNHAMGKARKQHLGKRPESSVEIVTQTTPIIKTGSRQPNKAKTAKHKQKKP